MIHPDRASFTLFQLPDQITAGISLGEKPKGRGMTWMDRRVAQSPL
jgi:hypothetical protein